MPLLHLSFASGEKSLSVRRFVIHEAVSSLFNVSVFARSLDSSVNLAALVGQPAGLRIESGYTFAYKPGRLWTGICAYAAQVQAESAPNLSTYLVKIVPVMWLLTKRSGHRIFQHLSIPDIVDKILGEWKIPPTWEVDRGRYPKLEFKVQYGESDFTFVSRLLEEAGIAFLFEDTGDETKLVLRDEPQAKTKRADALPYYQHANQAAEKEFVCEVEIGREIRPGGFVLQDYDFRRPQLVLGEQAPKAAAPEDKYEQVRYEPGTYLSELGSGGDTPNADDKGVARYDAGYGKDKAARLLAGARVGKLAVGFETNALDLRPGTILSFVDHVHPDVSERPLLVTNFTLEGSPTDAWRVKAYAVSAEIPYRPPAVTPKPLVHGIQSATVVGARDDLGTQEIHVDEFGRIRVQFPWDRDGKANDFASCWMRVNYGWGGKAYGFIRIPRVGHEVLVTFLDGDPDQPVITGCVYNARHPVPYKLPENKTISTWKSDSSLGSSGFNELKYEDKKGQELFYHQAEKDQRVLIKNDETITVLHDRRKDVARMETDTTAVNRFEVTAINRSEMTAVVRTTFIAGKRGKLVKRNKGVMNEGHRQLLAMQTHDIVIKKDKRERLQRDAHLYVKGDRRERVDDDRSFVVVEDLHEKIDGSYAAASGRSSSYQADETITGEGGRSVTAKGPGGYLCIDETGVTISGTMVRINVGGSPGKARPSKPAKAELAKELKQPKDAKVAEDLRADRDISTLRKHLAAMGKPVTDTSSVVGKKWGRVAIFQNRTVFQRGDLIDASQEDKRGRTNLSRMNQGLAPVDADGKSINLHHLIQSDAGSVAEVSGSFHEKYHKVIHINPHTTPSGIDRKKFAAWRRDYWKDRAKGLEGGAR